MEGKLGKLGNLNGFDGAWVVLGGGGLVVLGGGGGGVVVGLRVVQEAADGRGVQLLVGLKMVR